MSTFDVVENAGVVEVRGATAEEVIDALGALELVHEAQARHVDRTRDALLEVLMAHEVPLTPPATLRQTQRLAARRRALVITAAYTPESLAELRDEQQGTTRTWLSRRRKEHRLFSVQHRGRTYIPAFQVTEDGQVREEVAAVQRPLLTARIDGWSVWSWMTQPTSLLSGDTPESVAVSNPERAVRAAQRFAAEPAA